MNCPRCEDAGFIIADDTEGGECVVRCPGCRTTTPLDALMVAGVPPRARACTVDAMSQPQREVYSATLDAIYRGDSVYLSGDVGTGKTGIGACVLRASVANGKSIAWAHVNTWLRSIRETFKRAADDPKRMSESEILAALLDADVAVVDDMGSSEKLGAWEIDMVYAIVEGRDSAMRPTVYTSNLARASRNPNEKTIQSEYGDRIASRLGRCVRRSLGDLPDGRERLKSAAVTR